MRFGREHVIMGVKVALGAAAAIGLAMLLGLEYASTAGIITVLSILGTKRETLRIARGGWRRCWRARGLPLSALASWGILWRALRRTCSCLRSCAMPAGGDTR